ncbi:MAG TPA: peptide deformylase [Thermodesulfobacteriota bacterium]|nr:peptide deformylase [Thermodesulfobacteriota bacterium]
MPKLLQIAQLGHQILRKKADPVKNVKDIYIQNLIDDLIATVVEVNGVGIAAPQVYEPYQIFVIASHPNLRYPDAPKMEPIAIINPKINSHSEDLVKDWEGCLSIPGIRGLVPRYKSISVEYTTRNGERKERELTDFIARIFQHEYDHLNGTVFLDRLESNKDIITEKEYQKLIFRGQRD